MDKIKDMKKHIENPRTSSWIRSKDMKCSKQMLTTAPYFVCDYNKNYIYIYIYIIDKIKNLQKHMENPRNSSWIRSKTWKKHVEDPRTSSWIRSNNMTCSKQMLTTAPYFVCVYNKVYLFF